MAGLKNLYTKDFEIVLGDVRDMTRFTSHEKM